MNAAERGRETHNEAVSSNRDIEIVIALRLAHAFCVAGCLANLGRNLIPVLDRLRAGKHAAIMGEESYLCARVEFSPHCELFEFEWLTLLGRAGKESRFPCQRLHQLIAERILDDAAQGKVEKKSLVNTLPVTKSAIRD